MVKAIITVVVVIILGAAGFAIFHGNNSSTKTSNTADQTSAQTDATTPDQSSSESQAQTQTQSDNKGSTAAPTNPSTPSSNQSSPSSATHNVTISGYAFGPADLTIKKGDTVTWTNKDVVAHNVIENDGQTGPKSGDLNQNQTYSYTFTKTGTFSYYCSIHPYMTAKITVTD